MKKTPTYATRGRPVTEPLTLLIRGRELLATKGTWCKGELGKGKRGAGRPDRFCAIGALDEAANLAWRYEGGGAYGTSLNVPPVVKEATDYLAAAAGAPKGGNIAVTDFNDFEAKTVKDVLGVYDRAIELARADKRAAKKALVNA